LKSARDVAARIEAASRDDRRQRDRADGARKAPPGPEKSKLVAFGDSTFVANLAASEKELIEFDLFIGALEWLRERPANIGVEPRSFKYYEMDRSVALNADQLRYMPLLVATLVVFGWNWCLACSPAVTGVVREF